MSRAFRVRRQPRLGKGDCVARRLCLHVGHDLFGQRVSERGGGGRGSLVDDELSDRPALADEKSDEEVVAGSLLAREGHRRLDLDQPRLVPVLWLARDGGDRSPKGGAGRPVILVRTHDRWTLYLGDAVRELCVAQRRKVTHGLAGARIYVCAV